MPISFYFCLLLQLFGVLVGGYFFIISLFAYFEKKKKRPHTNKNHTFAIVIPAHNEERVIGHLIESLNSQNYPKNLYEVFVIADNCSDNTYEVAKSMGAAVFERKNNFARGKGYALEWGFNKIFELGKNFDAVVVFDADNIVDLNFLKVANEHLNLGEEVIQGYIESKNPFDTWITSSYTISFWITNRLFQNSRYNLNLSCQLCGTGFVVSADLLKKIGWKATCLTEDMEFTMRLALNNYKVSWAKDAVVYDEKPLTLISSWHQRIRWMKGHADVLFRFFKPLMKKAISDRDFIPVDCIMYLVTPIRIIANGIILVFALLQSFFPSGEFELFSIAYLFPSPVFYNLFVVLWFIYIPAVIFIEKNCFNIKMFYRYIQYGIYNLTWVPIAVWGVIKKGDRTWSHTIHNRTISIKELEKA